MCVDLAILIFMVFFGGFKDYTQQLVLSLLVCAITGIYIIFDLVVIILPGVADKDDYILYALNLYVDIARLFMHLMIILGKRDN